MFCQLPGLKSELVMMSKGATGRRLKRSYSFEMKMPSNQGSAPFLKTDFQIEYFCKKLMSLPAYFTTFLVRPLVLRGK